MAHKLSLIACLTLAGIAGCKACSDESDVSPAPEAERTEQSSRARVLSRLSARKIDRSKVYPKDAQGKVLCQTDVDCFILQAETCSGATFTHTLVNSGYGIKQSVNAHYVIGGKEGTRCKVERHVQAIDTAIDPVMAEALRKRGKSESEIDTVRADSIESLRRRHPPRLDCLFGESELLETTLNLADGRFDGKEWKAACRVVDAPPSAVGLPAEEQPAAADAPAAPEPAATGAKPEPAKPAEPDVPAPKQP